MSVSVTFTVAGAQAAALKERIKKEATDRGISVSEWITEACAEYLRSQNSGKVMEGTAE